MKRIALFAICCALSCSTATYVMKAQDNQEIENLREQYRELQLPMSEQEKLERLGILKPQIKAKWQDQAQALDKDS